MHTNILICAYIYTVHTCLKLFFTMLLKALPLSILCGHTVMDINSESSIDELFVRREVLSLEVSKQQHYMSLVDSAVVHWFHATAYRYVS